MDILKDVCIRNIPALFYSRNLLYMVRSEIMGCLPSIYGHVAVTELIPLVNRGS